MTIILLCVFGVLSICFLSSFFKSFWSVEIFHCPFRVVLEDNLCANISRLVMIVQFFDHSQCKSDRIARALGRNDVVTDHDDWFMDAHPKLSPHLFDQLFSLLWSMLLLIQLSIFIRRWLFIVVIARIYFCVDGRVASVVVIGVLIKKQPPIAKNEHWTGTNGPYQFLGAHMVSQKFDQMWIVGHDLGA